MRTKGMVEQRHHVAVGGQSGDEREVILSRLRLPIEKALAEQPVVGTG
jgi:hypothetical protein